MDRRDFLTKAGLVSLASAPLLVGLPQRAEADDENGATAFFFTGLSTSTVNPTGEQTTVAGAGRFSAADGEVEGGGCYNFVNTGAPKPNPLLEFGNWRAKRLVSWKPFGRYGSQGAGILVLGVTLFPVGGAHYDAMLKVVCNVPFVPLVTGEDEGFTLTTPTVTFVPAGTGITLFCFSFSSDD